MGRLIDADIFRRYAHEQLEGNKPYTIDEILKMIDEQSTAYDAELQTYRNLGTVEELQAIKDSTQLVTDILAEYSAIGTIEAFKNLKLKEHNYDNCHNVTCRRKCQNDGYNDVIDKFVEEITVKSAEASIKAVIDGGLAIDAVSLDYVSDVAMEIAEQLKKVGST